MDKKLQDMWANNRTLCIILGIVLLPITLIIIGIKVMAFFNELAAERSLKSTQKEDDKLKAQEDELKRQANKAMSDADRAAARIEDRHNDGAVDMDWNKKRND